ncbi:MAG: hypothetical protein Q9N34_05725 [Aquificota bacterium]|nr:hypothetical protein [Aquificota bacterium]
MRKKALMLAVLGTGFLFSCGGSSSGTDNETAEHGGGGSNLGAQFVNVSGQLTSQTATGFSAQACSASVNGKTPKYVVAVTLDQNGKVNAAGSSIDPSCNFSLKLNKAYAYALALFDSSYQPIAVFIYNNNKALKFSGDVNMIVGSNRHKQ